MLTPIQEHQAIHQANEWLAQGVIEPITNPSWTNNLVMVAKKDGRIRVCVDCTPANMVTRGYDWPLPRLQDLRYFVKDTQYYCRIDLKDAFFRISVPAHYRHLTAFRAGGQAYQFRRMPFGLKTAPAVFQRFMDHGLAPFGGWAMWYIDDILIQAPTLGQLRQREGALRRRLKEMKCQVNEAKSETGRKQILFAGVQICPRGLGANHEQTRRLLETPPPRSKAEAQSALGLVSYLRDFIPLVGHFTALLYPNKEGLRLPLPEYQEKWYELLRHLAQAMIINHHWKEGKTANLYADASQYALGTVIIQEGRVTMLAARKLTGAETRYSATDREHLGLVYSAEKFKLILHQSTTPVKVWTDHQALITRDVSRLTPRQARWHDTITTWMPKLTHVPGKLNPADFISRLRVGSVGAVIAV